MPNAECKIDKSRRETAPHLEKVRVSSLQGSSFLVQVLGGGQAH
jgi:hypothetical protein